MNIGRVLSNKTFTQNDKSYLDPLLTNEKLN